MNDKKELQRIVRNILLTNEAARDSDRLLIVEIWKAEAVEQYLVSSESLLRAFLDCKLPMPDSITRARRKLQEEIPTLRGKRYGERKQMGVDYKP